MLRKYEALYILKHDSEPDATANARQKMIEIIENGGGMLIKEDVWGKKKLAFDVKKYSKGIYVLLTFLAEPEQIFELERNMKINNEIIRYLTVKIEDKIDLEAEKAEKESWEAEAARKAEERKARAEAGDNADDDDDDAKDADDDDDEKSDKDDDDGEKSDKDDDDDDDDDEKSDKDDDDDDDDDDDKNDKDDDDDDDDEDEKKDKD